MAGYIIGTLIAVSGVAYAAWMNTKKGSNDNEDEDDDGDEKE